MLLKTAWKLERIAEEKTEMMKNGEPSLSATRPVVLKKRFPK